MNAAQPLPAYSDEALRQLSPDELVDLLVGDEDRAPRNVIDECARQGEAMVDCLNGLLEDDACWRHDATRGQWWLLLHAMMILGLISGDRAGQVLVEFMRRMAREENEVLRDWIGGDWPALFRNKPESVVAALRALCEDRGLDWFSRANAVDAVVAAARQQDSQMLDNALAWVAGIASDEQENWDMRLAVGNLLLNFPRALYRPLLESLAQRQTGWNVFFSNDDIRDAYQAAQDKPEWERRDNPWAFYAPAAIEKRQQRWATEDGGADQDEWDDAALEAAAAPSVQATVKIGRNDPCPCGSGKKYKKCCLRAESATVEMPEEFLRRRIRVVIEDLPAQLLRFVRAQLGDELIDEAWANFTGEEEAFDPETPHIPVFMPWFFFQWCPDPEDTRFPDLAAREATVAGEFIARRGRHLDPLLVRYLEACMAAPFSFHEVARLQAGRGFALRDLMLERETFVIEHSASRSVAPGDILFAQIVTIDGLSLLEGCAPVVLQPKEKPRLIDLRKAIRAQGDLFGEALLKQRSSELIELYLDLAQRVLNPALPELQNTDGEPLELRTLVFAIADCAAAAAAFDAARLADAESIVQDDVRHGADGTLVGGEWTWRKAGNKLHKGWDNTSLGQLMLADGRLKVHVNSAARAARAKALVEDLLKGNASYRVTEIASTESMLAQAKTGPAPKNDGEQERLMQMPEVRQHLAQMLMQHYTQWLETELPALGERTPREAARDRDGREAVGALIAQIERDGARQAPPLDPEIPAMLRRELGLG